MNLLALVVDTSRQLAETRARNAKIGAIAACLRRLAPDEIAPAVAFLTGEPRQGRIGLGQAIVREIAAEPAREPALTVLDVDAALSRMQQLGGAGSQGARKQALAELLARATAGEQSFLQRLLLGELRQGALEGLMQDAIAQAVDLPAGDVRRAAMFAGDLGAVAMAALTEGSGGLARFALQLHRPLLPMLARTAGDVDEALGVLGRAFLEWKLDGARIQVHRAGADVRVFSRQRNDVTAAVPEVVEAVLRLPVRQVVLDGEAIALEAGGRPRPFQVTMRRFGRRLDVEGLRAEIPLTPFFFDALHVDGQDLTGLGAAERLRAVSGVIPPALLVPRIETADAEAADAFFTAALERGHEGIMAKSIDAPYEAGRRGAAWLKVKPAHTLDLVVLAAEWGSGRRRGWLSNLHLGARDPGSGAFVMLGKTFKGMTDELLRWQTQRLLELETARDEHVVLVRPELVVEVAFDGVQASPHYPGGMALRFARVRRYRTDKRADEADTVETVRALHAGGPGTR